MPVYRKVITATKKCIIDVCADSQSEAWETYEKWRNEQGNHGAVVATVVDRSKMEWQYAPFIERSEKCDVLADITLTAFHEDNTVEEENAEKTDNGPRYILVFNYEENTELPLAIRGRKAYYKRSMDDIMKIINRWTKDFVLTLTKSYKRDNISGHDIYFFEYKAIQKEGAVSKDFKEVIVDG